MGRSIIQPPPFVSTTRGRPWIPDMTRKPTKRCIFFVLGVGRARASFILVSNMNSRCLTCLELVKGLFELPSGNHLDVSKGPSKTFRLLALPNIPVELAVGPHRICDAAEGMRLRGHSTSVQRSAKVELPPVSFLQLDNSFHSSLIGQAYLYASPSSRLNMYTDYYAIPRSSNSEPEPALLHPGGPDKRPTWMTQTEVSAPRLREGILSHMLILSDPLGDLFQAHGPQMMR